MEASATLKLTIRELDVLRLALADSVWRNHEIVRDTTNAPADVRAAARAAEAQASDLLAKLK